MFILSLIELIFFSLLALIAPVKQLPSANLAFKCVDMGRKKFLSKRQTPQRDPSLGGRSHLPGPVGTEQYKGVLIVNTELLHPWRCRHSSSCLPVLCFCRASQGLSFDLTDVEQHLLLLLSRYRIDLL